MVGDLNKMFDKNFVIGHVIPATAFMAASMGLLHGFGRLPQWLTIDPRDPLKDTTFVALLVLVLAIVLMALNRLIFRTLEGYWPLGLGRLLNFYQRWQWRRLFADYSQTKYRCEQLKPEWESGNQPVDFGLLERYKKLAQRFARDFPSEESLVLPTRFGNAVRAFEDYAYVMYSFDSITGWSRLQAVVSKEYREIQDGARAETDLWVNLWMLSLVVLMEYLLLANGTGHHPFPWACALALGSAWAASRQARLAAIQWSEWVKGAFDVYLPELCKMLGYVRPARSEEERDLWSDFSRAVTYRDVESLQVLDVYREQPEAAGTPRPRRRHRRPRRLSRRHASP